MSNKSRKYRIYPTKEQAELFDKTFGCCRKIWNLMLDDKIKQYKATGLFGNTTPAQYKTDYPFLKEVDSLALANVQLNLQQAMKNCFVSKHCKFPVFKSLKHDKKSYTTNNQKGTIAVFDNAVKLPKAGIVKAKIHYTPKPDWNVKSATVSKSADNKYYISVLFEYETKNVAYMIDPDNAVGLDYKSDGLFVSSDGEICDNPHWYRDSEKKLKKEQRKLSRMVKDSANYNKQKTKIARISAHTANQRKDFLHKKTTEIANQYDIVCIEDLNMRTMSNKLFKNGKATLDNGFGMFKTFLKYKLEDRGKALIVIDKWFPSSQLCGCCGIKNPAVKNLAVRSWTCPVCKTTHDRDYNAATNILNEGLRLLKTV